MKTIWTSWRAVRPRVRIETLRNFFLAALLILLTSPSASRAAVRGDDYDTDRTPPRLGFMNGEVSYWRPGAEDWAPAQVNTPLAPGDSLYAAGDDASFELQIGARAFVRGGGGTQLVLQNQEPDFVQFTVTAGHAGLDLRTLSPGQTVELDTPNAAFRVETPGYYRIDVTGDTSTFVARRGGRASVIVAGGDGSTIGVNEQFVIEGTDAPRITTYAAPDLDAWDQWNYDRTEEIIESASARYVPPDVYGAADLDRYGSWRATAEYGPVWAPAHVAVDWSPYSDGRWVWDPYYGWSWVDYAPWGWAPSHYGRWVHTSGYWGWAPGPVIATPVYSPALVAFFGGHNFGVSIGIGAPSVGWVALGWGEPVVPWWGHRDYGHASWDGWGGPRVVNNVVIENNTVVNVTNINHYRNADVRNAVIAAREDRFGRGRNEHIRIARADARNLQAVRGRVPVRPVAASLTANEGRGRRPPENVRQRSVVATRAPRDTAARLRAEGIEVQNKRGPEPRIVSKLRDRPSEPARATSGVRDRQERARRPAPGPERGRVESPERNRNRERASESSPQRPAGGAVGSVPPVPEERRRQRARGTEERAPRASRPETGAPSVSERQRRDAERPQPQSREAARPAPPRAESSQAPSSRSSEVRAPDRGRQRERARNMPDAPGSQAPRAEQRREAAKPQPPRREAARPEPPRREAARPEPRREAARPEPQRREAARPEPRREAAQPQPQQQPRVERRQAPSSRAGDAPAASERRPQRERLMRDSGSGQTKAEERLETTAPKQNQAPSGRSARERQRREAH